MGRLIRAGLIVGVVVALVAAPAAATFRGGNGKIAHVHTTGGNTEIYTVNPDGSDRTNITNHPASDVSPRWSPDGTKIAFQRGPSAGNTDIWLMNADGSGETPLTSDPANDFGPTWAPDGMKIAFSSDRDADGSPELWTMDADGSNEMLLTDGPRTDAAPSWSPDSSQLVFQRDTSGTACCTQDIYRIDADGSGLTLLTPESQHTRNEVPLWSPDGSTIAFEDYRTPWEGNHDIRAMKPDGSGKRFVYSAFPSPDLRSWEPAGQRLLVTPISTMNADGTDQHHWAANHQHPPDSVVYYSYSGAIWSPDTRYLAGNRAQCYREVFPCDPVQIYVLHMGSDTLTEIGPGLSPDWQPVFPNAYPRPKSARPIQVTLVPAYVKCIGPSNRIHGYPLAYYSCHPPQQSSSELTVGTPDANGKGANSTTGVLIDPVPGNLSTPADEADIRLRGQIKDVRLASDLSDYTGALEARVSVRITDKHNTPSSDGPGAATAQDLTYSFPLSCTATAATAIGGECNVDTTAEALVPGIAKEGLRAIWQLGQVAVHDTSGGVFMRQGIFVP